MAVTRGADWPDHAGLFGWLTAPVTGTQVGIYVSAEAGFDSDRDNPYSTVCEPHGGFCSHRTKALARAHAPNPERWCPTCQEAAGCADCGATDPRHDPDCPTEGTLMPTVRMVRLPSLTPREAAALQPVLYELVVRDPVAERALTKVLDALVPKTPTAPLAPEGLPS